MLVFHFIIYLFYFFECKVTIFFLILHKKLVLFFTQQKKYGKVRTRI